MSDRLLFRLLLNKNGRLMPHMTTRCWEWTGAVGSHGYGVGKFECGERTAHRASYIVLKKKRKTKRPILHECDNKICCRPIHIDKGSFSKNTKDAYDRGLIPKGKDHWTANDKAKVSKRSKAAWKKHRLRIVKARNEKRGKLSEDKVRKARKLYNSGNYTQQALADKFNVSISSMNHCIRGISWTFVK